MPDTLTEVTPDGVMVVTLNRPETLNSLSAEMSAGIAAAVEQASAEGSGVRVVILTGAGRGFCSGADAVRRSQAEATPRPTTAQMERRKSVPEVLASSTVPIIAAVNGPAAGAGFGIALSCDMRLMAESARIGPVFIKRGIATDSAVAFWLPRMVGITKAFELIYTGDLLDAPTALDLRIVNRVLPDDQLMPEAMAWARRIVDGPPLGYAGTRRQLMRSMGADSELSDYMDFEGSIQMPLLDTDDALEGFRSFLERREPVFKGS